MNINMLMQQAKKMQAEMEKKSAEFKGKLFTETFQGGAITIEMKGSYKIESIKIDPELLDKDSKDILEDMIKMAINETITKIKKAEEAMAPKAPGMF